MRHDPSGSLGDCNDGSILFQGWVYAIPTSGTGAVLHWNTGGSGASSIWAPGGVVVDDGTLRALVLATKRGPRAVTGKIFVDCTGDADVAVFAGVPTELGPPGSRQFGSMQFVMQHVDAPAAMAAVPALGDLIGEHGAHLSRDGGAIIPTFRPGEFVGAMTRVRNRDGTPVDVTDVRQATWGELEGRRLAEEAAAFLRAHVPGFADAFLDDTATALGVRETRRVVGDYVLTGDDVTRGASFGDAVARGAWPREYHVRGRTTEYEFLPAGTSYQVPFGSLATSASTASRE